MLYESLMVWVLACFLLLLDGSSAAKNSIPAHYINDNVLRSLDLSASIVRERQVIAITLSTEGEKALAQKKLSAYHLSIFLPLEALTLQLNTTVAHVRVKEKDSDAELPLKQISLEKSTDVQVSKPEQRTVLIIDIAYSHALSPFPVEVGQNERQRMRYFGNIYLDSPYPTKKQKLKVNLASISVDEYTQKPEPVSKSGKTIVYGTYEKEVAPFTHIPLAIRAENNNPMLTVKTLVREFWLSHWGGNVAVEEHYRIQHQGAHLKGLFSRIDFKLNSMSHHQTSVVQSFKIELPVSAKDVYYRDDVGNVSTSNFRIEKKRSLLELEPRFPLYGGWFYTWHHGYNAPLGNFVKRTGASSYLFQAPFIKGIENVATDEAVIKVVLPEGATNFKVHSSFGFSETNVSQTFTYLDSIGRPTLFLKKFHLVDEHAAPFQISYDFPAEAYLRKPLVVMSGIAFIFVISMICYRMDLAIKNSEK